MSRFIIIVSTFALLAGASAIAQETVMAEVRVEASFSSSLELPSNSASAEMIARMTLRDETSRVLDLAKANESAATKLLALTRFIPIPLGSSENRVDTFFLRNDMRADLNPRYEDPLALGR